MLAEDHELATQLVNDLALVFGLAVLQHMLYHVVAILVMHEVLRLLVQFFQDAGNLNRQQLIRICQLTL